MSQAGLSNITSSPSIPTTFTTDSGIATPAANNLNIVGGTDILTSGMGSTVTITFTGSAISWSVVTSADNPVTLTANKGYIAKGAGVVDFVLPAAATEGDTFLIAGYGNLWTIAQNAGQSLTLGNITTTPGVGGSLSASMVTDSIEIICVTANTEFKVINMMGNPIVV